MNTWNSVSDTAEFGGPEEVPELVDERGQANMEDALERVQQGEFARKCISENGSGRPSYKQLRSMESNHDIEDIGGRLRELCEWTECLTDSPGTVRRDGRSPVRPPWRNP